MTCFVAVNNTNIVQKYQNIKKFYFPKKRMYYIDLFDKLLL